MCLITPVVKCSASLIGTLLTVTRQRVAEDFVELQAEYDALANKEAHLQAILSGLPVAVALERAVDLRLLRTCTRL